MYFFHKFVLDDIGLDTALYVFIPFGAFFLLSLFMVYLEKPVIKKVAKSEYGRRRRKNAQEESSLPRGTQEYAEFSGNYPPRGTGRQRHTEAPQQMPINQETFNRAKQQTATMNAIHESGMVHTQPRAGAAASPKQAAPADRPAAAQSPSAQPAAAQRQDISRANQPQRPSRPAVPQTAGQASRQMPGQQVPQKPAPAELPAERGAYQRAVRSHPELQGGSTVQRRSALQEAAAQVPAAYQRPAARQAAGAPVDASVYQRPAAPARPTAQQSAAYQRPAAAQPDQRLEPRQRAGAEYSVERPIERPETARQDPRPLSDFHSQAIQRQRAVQQYSARQAQANPYSSRNPYAAANRQQQGQPYSPSGQIARPQPPVNLSGTEYARRNPYGEGK